MTDRSSAHSMYDKQHVALLAVLRELRVAASGCKAALQQSFVTLLTSYQGCLAVFILAAFSTARLF